MNTILGILLADNPNDTGFSPLMIILVVILALGILGLIYRIVIDLGGDKLMPHKMPAPQPRKPSMNLNELQTLPQVQQTSEPPPPPAQPANVVKPVRSGYQVVEEFSGNSALRGDFVDILGAMGKKLDQVVKSAEESRAIVNDLKKQNEQLEREKAQLLDLLQNDRHRILLRNLVKAANFCELSIRGLKDNPKAVEALGFVRDECRDRLVDAGLTPYEPGLGTHLTDLEGALFETHARTVPTDQADRNNTLAEVHSVGYYYERDGKKIPVAKAELVFYRLSPASNPNPPEQAPQ